MQFRFCPLCASELVMVANKGPDPDRLACSADDCNFIHYNNPTPVVAAIVEHGDDVLLVRNHGWPESWFGIVTGFLEANETPEDGILRELHEELGLAGELVEMVGVYAFEMKNELIVAYHVRAEGEVVLGDEIADYKRVPITKLKAWSFGTGLAVQDWLDARSKPKT